MKTEAEILNRLFARLSTHRDVIVGPGDDCAVVRVPGAKHDLLLTSDPVVQGVHFLSGAEPETVGHKALGRSLSDIAAMGGEPLWCLIDVIIPRNIPEEWLLRVYEGFSRLAEKYKVTIAGGDISRGKGIELHVFCVGRVERGKAVLRSGARAGNRIFITGRLGEREPEKDLVCQPRIREARWLLKHDFPTAMMDISDGLATDIKHLAEQSSKGASLDLSLLPLSTRLKKLKSSKNAIKKALCNGEDYELLFTVKAKDSNVLQSAWNKEFNVPCTEVGTITSEAGRIECRDVNGKKRLLKESGYDHFARP